MRKARFVKYVVLLVVIIVFFLSRNRTTLAADPLISFFNPATLGFDRYPPLAGQSSILDFRSAMLLIVATALIGSIFYGRFWCRYLCPAGAFLSLLNNVAILKRYLPAKRFGQCEFGLTTKDKMDCIHCDRCRYSKQVRKGAREQGYKRAQVLVPYVLTVAIFVSAVSVSRFMQVVPMGRDYSAALAPSGGQSRDVDMQRIRILLEQKRLSDREAEFYKKVE
jgi:hypothetical protein